jgi:hypothetical protein
MKTAMAVVVLSSLLSAGCGKRGPAMAPVEGRVTLDGLPLADATVYFQPMQSPDSSVTTGELGPASFGKTDADGRYSLRTVDGDVQGAMVTAHVVTITDAPQGKVDPTSDEGVQSTSKIPTRYWVDSELRFTVKAEGDKNADFPLTTEKKPRN